MGKKESKTYESYCKLAKLENIYNQLNNPEYVRIWVQTKERYSGESNVPEAEISDEKIIDIIRSYYAEQINKAKADLKLEMDRILQV